MSPTPDPYGAFSPWTYRSEAGWAADFDLVDYHVEATDGSIGKVDEASNTVDESYLVVDTGPWIFGKRVLIPAGTVTRIDHAERLIYVDRTKQQVKDSPEFDPDVYTEPSYRDKVGGYYGDTYRGGDTS
ncbi:MAG TPA: PRC-barrel domain containing protein [Micromonosporaceae bacterium]